VDQLYTPIISLSDVADGKRVTVKKFSESTFLPTLVGPSNVKLGPGLHGTFLDMNCVQFPTKFTDVALILSEHRLAERHGVSLPVKKEGWGEWATKGLKRAPSMVFSGVVGALGYFTDVGPRPVVGKTCKVKFGISPDHHRDEIHLRGDYLRASHLAARLPAGGYLSTGQHYKAKRFGEVELGCATPGSDETLPRVGESRAYYEETQKELLTLKKQFLAAHETQDSFLIGLTTLRISMALLQLRGTEKIAERDEGKREEEGKDIDVVLDTKPFECENNKKQTLFTSKELEILPEPLRKPGKPFRRGTLATRPGKFGDMERRKQQTNRRFAASKAPRRSAAGDGYRQEQFRSRSIGARKQKKHTKKHNRKPRRK